MNFNFKYDMTKDSDCCPYYDQVIIQILLFRLFCCCRFSSKPIWYLAIYLS